MHIVTSLKFSSKSCQTLSQHSYVVYEEHQYPSFKTSYLVFFEFFEMNPSNPYHYGISTTIYYKVITNQIHFLPVDLRMSNILAIRQGQGNQVLVWCV